MPALLDPPATTAELRERAAELADDVAHQLVPVAEPDAADPAVIAAPGERARRSRVADRQEFFEALHATVRSISESPAWRSHDLTTELLLLLDRLRDELAGDPEAIDPQWRVRETLQRMLVVIEAMVRQLEHNELDRPEDAARFVVRAFSDIEVGKVARLLDISNRMVSNYRQGEISQVRKNPDRVTLVAQLVSELLGSMTPRGALLWFDAPRPQLDQRTPRELIDESAVAHRSTLISLARGGRAQTDQGSARYGSLDSPS